MTDFDSLVEEIHSLDEEKLSVVFQFVRMLKQLERQVPEQELLRGEFLELWRKKVLAQSCKTLEEQRRKLIALGIAVDGDIPESAWPQDMHPTSKTSVAT